MVKDVAVPGQGGLAVAVARMVDRLVAEWTAGQQRLTSTRSRSGDAAATSLRERPNAEDLLMRVDPLIAVRWRGSW
ncbi:hypothetical protein [Nocardia altamirensis]|uniref:hypothetical protein n=1 Tax=Nocardia altamirensis TaxID=472158 RepID=UPI0008408066|nr:hypothetical protein [Nocardia altamirensis]